MVKHLAGGAKIHHLTNLSQLISWYRLSMHFLQKIECLKNEISFVGFSKLSINIFGQIDKVIF